MQNFFNHHDESMYLIPEGSNGTDGDKIELRTGDRFNDNMYYLAPFYHEIFPELDKLIMLDSDLEFKVDPAMLYDEFSHFSEYQLIGIANDLSPHYYQMLSKLVRNIKLQHNTLYMYLERCIMPSVMLLVIAEITRTPWWGCPGDSKA